MRIVITGGGTGGHVYPAIAVARGIKQRWPDAGILFVGTKGRTEATAVPAAGFPIKFINAAGLSTTPAGLFKFIVSNAAGFIQSFTILRKYKPYLTVGTGGFVSAPVLAASFVLGIPYVILEQNVVPGKANRFVAKGASKILVNFEGAEKFLPKKKTVTTGNPVRPEIIKRTREEAVEKLKLPQRNFNLLITGASQGAKSINEAVIKSLPMWKDKNWNVLHLTGPKNYDEVKEQTGKIKEEMAGEYRCVDYTEDMASYLAATDLMVGRSGATTLSEIFVRGIPAVLIPYPHHADNHGLKNARWVEEQGGAVVILDNEVKDRLADIVLKLSEDKKRLEKMGAACKALGKPNAMKTIIDEIESVLHT